MIVNMRSGGRYHNNGEQLPTSSGVSAVSHEPIPIIDVYFSREHSFWPFFTNGALPRLGMVIENDF